MCNRDIGTNVDGTAEKHIAIIRRDIAQNIVRVCGVIRQRSKRLDAGAGPRTCRQGERGILAEGHRMMARRAIDRAGKTKVLHDTRRRWNRKIAIKRYRSTKCCVVTIRGKCRRRRDIDGTGKTIGSARGRHVIIESGRARIADHERSHVARSIVKRDATATRHGHGVKCPRKSARKINQTRRVGAPRESHASTLRHRSCKIHRAIISAVFISGGNRRHGCTKSRRDRIGNIE